MKYFIIIKEHSERVVGKNFIDIGGLPLWKHLVYELEGESVYIDTDSSAVLNECASLSWVTAYPRGQKFIDYENNNESRFSPVLMMIDNFLDTYVEDDDEIVITPHVTSPFLKQKTIKNALKKLNEGYDSVHSVTEHREFSYYKGKPINFIPNIVQKTQDLEPIVMSNGAFFAFTKKTFKENNNRMGKRPYFYVLPPIEDIEIDNNNDLKLAKIVYKEWK
jgi:N-acylneuraminate cytidylyltransferase